MTIKELQKSSYRNAKKKGFWDKERNNGEMIALMHSELSEALEALRKNDWENVAEELVDCIIRIGDFAEGRKINLTKALKEKMVINKKRPYKHGKKFKR